MITNSEIKQSFLIDVAGNTLHKVPISKKFLVYPLIFEYCIYVDR